MKVAASQLRKGSVVDLAGKLYVVLTAQNIHPGKGTPVTQLDMRRILRRGEGVGALPHRRAGGARLRRRREYSFLYQDAKGYDFMDPANYDQIDDSARDRRPPGDLPAGRHAGAHLDPRRRAHLHGAAGAVTLEIVETEPVVKGQTAVRRSTSRGARQRPAHRRSRPTSPSRQGGGAHRGRVVRRSGRRTSAPEPLDRAGRGRARSKRPRRRRSKSERDAAGTDTVHEATEARPRRHEGAQLAAGGQHPIDSHLEVVDLGVDVDIAAPGSSCAGSRPSSVAPASRPHVARRPAEHRAEEGADRERILRADGEERCLADCGLGHELTPRGGRVTASGCRSASSVAAGWLCDASD